MKATAENMANWLFLFLSFPCPYQIFTTSKPSFEHSSWSQYHSTIQIPHFSLIFLEKKYKYLWTENSSSVLIFYRSLLSGLPILCFTNWYDVSSLISLLLIPPTNSSSPNQWITLLRSTPVVFSHMAKWLWIEYPTSNKSEKEHSLINRYFHIFTWCYPGPLSKGSCSPRLYYF